MLFNCIQDLENQKNYYILVKNCPYLPEAKISYLKMSNLQDSSRSILIKKCYKSPHSDRVPCVVRTLLKNPQVQQNQLSKLI